MCVFGMCDVCFSDVRCVFLFIVWCVRMCDVWLVSTMCEVWLLSMFYVCFVSMGDM